jgi:FkbM family methyltransferase
MTTAEARRLRLPVPARIPPRVMRLLPAGVKDALVPYVLLSDRSSRGLFRAGHGRRGDAFFVHVRALDGAGLWLRPGYEDMYVLRESMLSMDALPPAGMDPKRIFDFGANIGVTMALLAHTFPDASVIGFEPDPSNAELCRRNVAPWGDRCEVVEAAVHTSDGRVRLSGDTMSMLRVGAGPGAEVEAVSLTTLLDRYGPVDYVKIDIEGGERDLLAQDAGWERIACVSVEVHPPYTPGACESDLRRLGFDVSLGSGRRGPRIIGARPGIP